MTSLDDWHGARGLGWSRAVFDAVPDQLAVLDGEGAIVEVNSAWRTFAAQSGASPGLTGVGVNYLAVCDAAALGAVEGAARAADGIRAVLEGRHKRFVLEYPCPAPARPRWFVMTVVPLAIPGGGAVVSHADITERRFAEMARCNSELRLQLALEATGDGLWDWDLRTGRAYLSPGYYALIGYRPEEITPGFEFFRQSVHPEDWPAVLATLEAHLRGETPVSDIEYRMVTASGALRWIRGRGKVVERGTGGEPLRMVGHITDVTERKRIEQALQEREAQYRAVVEDQTEVIARFLADGTMVFVNEVYCRVFGKTPAELIGSKWQPVVHPDDLAMIEAGLAELSPSNPVVVIENRVRVATGELRWMQFVNRAFFDADGSLREMQAVGRDITDRKRVELALQESEARYRAVVEDQTELISRLSHDGTFVFANAAYCRFFGTTLERVIGTRWQPIAYPDDLAMAEAQLAEMSPARPVITLESRVFAGDGSVHWMQFVNRGFFGADGRMVEFQSVGRDITDRKEAEARQLALLEENTRLGRELIRLQEKERADLAKDLHDELSQHLTAIRAYAGAIERRARGAAGRNLEDALAIEASASQIYAASHRLMEGLHPQILDSAGLDDILRGLVSEWSSRHAGTRVRLRLAGHFGALDTGVRIHLFRIAQESLSNVLRHARAARVRIFLGEILCGGQRWLRLVIRDDGVGMDTALRRTGHGLIVMRERARNLGGTFDLSSRPGRGVRVAVEVPIPAGEEGALPRVPPGPPGSPHG
jgi:two-component system, NarL family, sensor histidine kinase UhpB